MFLLSTQMSHRQNRKFTATIYKTIHKMMLPTASFLFLASPSITSTVAHAASATVDSDGDTVNDAFDVFPCDVNLASIQSIPATGEFSSLLFEDQWPSQGDFDFNDFVVDYHVEVFKSAAGQVRQLRYTFVPKAAGALFDNGLAIQLPVVKNNVAGLQVTRQIGSDAAEAINVKTDEANVTFVVVENIRQELFAGASAHINTVEGGSQVIGQRVVITVDFAQNVALNTADAPFDVFLFRSGAFSHQIHKTRFSGTNAMDNALFATGDDGSSARNQVNGRFFVDKRGVPFVLDVPTSTRYPQEGVRFENLYPRIIDFAVSGGTQFQNFFDIDTDLAQASSFVFANPSVPALNTDQSCLPFECISPDPAVILANSVGGQTDVQFDNQCRAYVTTTLGFDFISVVDRNGLVQRISGPFDDNLSALAIDQARNKVYFGSNQNGPNFISVADLLAGSSARFISGGGANSSFWDNFHANQGPTSLVNDDIGDCLLAPALMSQNELACVNKTTGSVDTVATFTERNETVAVNSSGILFASAGDSLFVVDRATGNTVLFVKLPSNILDVAIDPANDDMYLELTDDTIRKVTASGTVTTFMEYLSGDARLTISPDRRLYRVQTNPLSEAVLTVVPLP